MPVVWPFSPSSISETLEFATDVRGSATGEMRDTLKEATQRFTLGHILTHEAAAKAQGLMASNPLAEWYVPIWVDATQVTSTIASGATSLTVETDAEFTAGGLAIIIKDSDNYELVTIDTVGSGSVTLTGAVVATYAPKVMVAPVRRCIAPSGLSGGVIVGATSLTVEFLALDMTDIGASTLPTLDGLDVLADSPKVAEPLTISETQAFELVSNGFGSYDMIATQTYSRERRRVAFADHDRSARHARRKWLHHVRGRMRPFWLPTFQNDLPLTADIGSGDTVITTGIYSPVAADLIGRGVMIWDDAGAVYRKITDATTSFGAHNLTIAAPGRAFVAANTRVALMRVVRFDADTFDLEHVFTSSGILSRFGSVTVEVPA